MRAMTTSMKHLLQLTRIALKSFTMVFMLSCTMAQEPSKNALSLDKSVRIGHLTNGFTYYLKSTTDTDKINLRFYVKVGALNEKQLRSRQYAHLLEHLGATEGYLETY